MARRHDQVFAAPTTERGDLAGDGDLALYFEYVEELRKVPTLTVVDEVVAFARQPLPPDFRQGQRPNARREARDDPDRLREEQASDLERVYAEYTGGAVAPKKKGRARTNTVKTAARKRTPSRTKRSKSKS
jgi:hypothetical protein